MKQIIEAFRLWRLAVFPLSADPFDDVVAQQQIFEGRRFWQAIAPDTDEGWRQERLKDEILYVVLRNTWSRAKVGERRRALRGDRP